MGKIICCLRAADVRSLQTDRLFALNNIILFAGVKIAGDDADSLDKGGGIIFCNDCVAKKKTWEQKQNEKHMRRILIPLGERVQVWAT